MFPKNVVKNKVVYIPNAIDGNKYKFNEELRNKKDVKSAAMKLWR